MPPRRYVSYLRVSTASQGQSGLGLEAQEAAVQSFLATHGGTLAASFVEVESGRKSERRRLHEAFAACRLHRAVLLVAKLDRLSRDAAFLLGLESARVDFVCCDNPHATRLTINVLAVVADEEARTISLRTKAALAAARARGTILGRPENLNINPASV